MVYRVQYRVGTGGWGGGTLINYDGDLKQGKAKTQLHDWINDKINVEETEKSLGTIVSLVSNWECVPTVLDSLPGYTCNILHILDQTESAAIERLITELFNQIVQNYNLTLEAFLENGWLIDDKLLSAYS
ncbi:hypothetical protein LOTGIDRAFT_159198 [Lottia gigantea]|uniref:Uncharacterized protein n=1 Tax=Lottia gigantea TaxID=225164 RepID=V4AML9_LOTGI|nr:hypothetical protein LOTGIDRAFT_159198 [Lottia gigantea]ESO98392.1 hypothetical protein LOTGIDRAFT_159198 [Lottia gigantea]